MSAKHTPGPWTFDGRPWNQVVWSDSENRVCFLAHSNGRDDERDVATGRLIAAAPELLEVLHEGRRAIGDHFAPNDCYATGPLTGDVYRDLVECPACSFIAMYDAVIAKATGAA